MFLYSRPSLFKQSFNVYFEMLLCMLFQMTRNFLAFLVALFHDISWKLFTGEIQLYRLFLTIIYHSYRAIWLSKLPGRYTSKVKLFMLHSVHITIQLIQVIFWPRGSKSKKGVNLRVGGVNTNLELLSQNFKYPFSELRAPSGGQMKLLYRVTATFICMICTIHNYNHILKNEALMKIPFESFKYSKNIFVTIFNNWIHTT